MKKFKKKFLNELNIKDNSSSLKKTLEIKSDKRKIYIPKRITPGTLIMRFASVFIFSGLAVFGALSYFRYINMPTYQSMQVLESLLNDDSQLSVTSIFDIPSIENPNHDLVSDPFKETIDGDFEIVLSEDIEYYTQASETITIIINLENPQSFEILSFTLNNRLYQSFEFLPGSNSEQLLISFTVQDFSGPQDLTIDAIKYVEGTSINDARFEGDPTIKIGVEYDTLPNISNVAELTESTSFGVSFTLNNHYDLINTDSPAYLYVFDGETIINQFTLQVGNNVVPFTNLKMGTAYEYAIVAAFDPLDGLGRRAFVLEGNTFTTNQGINESNLTSSYDSVSFDLLTLDDKVAGIVSIKVYQNDTLIQEISESSTSYSVSDLLSNTTYTFDVEYSYTFSSEETDTVLFDTYRFEAKTLEKEIPTLVLDVSSSSDSITFEMTFSDETIVSVEKIELFLNNELVSTLTSFDSLSFLELLSNTNYSLKVTYSYDLNDGNGAITVELNNEFSTLENITPELTLTSMIAFGDSIFASFLVDDPDNLMNLVRFDLYKDDILIGSVLAEDIQLLETNEENVLKGDLVFDFDGSGDYLLVAIYSYDLNDGNGLIVIDSTDVNASNTLRYIAV
jgi:hypothetical protein